MIFKLVKGLQNPYTFLQNMIGNSSFCQVQDQDHNLEMRGFWFLEKKHVTQEYIQIQSDSMKGLLYPQDSLLKVEKHYKCGRHATPKCNTETLNNIRLGSKQELHLLG